MKQSSSLSEARFGEHHGLRLSSRIGNEPLVMQPVHRLPIEALPGAVAIMKPEEQQGQHGLVDLVVVEGHGVQLALRGAVRCKMPSMSSRAQELLREALALSIEDRADVAAELLASLDDAEADNLAEVEAAWAAEIERRARRVLAGESVGTTWDDVRSRAQAELRKR